MGAPSVEPLVSTPWRPLERRTLFVSCSSDMEAEANVVQTVLEELNRQLPVGDRWDFYRWTEVDETWSVTTTFQQNIPRASDPNVGLVICLFGERLGTPLPHYFPCPPELTLPPWVKCPWTHGVDARSVPLTGTLFELFDAVQGSPDSRTRTKIFCYIKVDRSLFTTLGLSPEDREYGFEHLYTRLTLGKKRIHDISPSITGNQVECFVGVHAEALQTGGPLPLKKRLNLNFP